MKDRKTVKQVEYLDLEEIDEKAQVFFFLSGVTRDEVLSREQRFDRWLDQVDR